MAYTEAPDKIVQRSVALKMSFCEKGTTGNCGAFWIISVFAGILTVPFNSGGNL